MRGECLTPSDECPYANRPGGCHSDIHHIYYPKPDYSDIIDAEFRELPENKQQKCRWQHEQDHLQEPTPELPDREFMLGRIALAHRSGEIKLSKRKLRKLGLSALKTNI